MTPQIKITPPGPNARAIVARDTVALATTTKTSPVVAKSASGSLVEDVDGNVFVDFASGIGVLNVGHSHPRIVAAITEQTAKFTHFAGTDFYYEQQVTLAERLGKLAPGRNPKKVFFANSGSEANEAALKIAKHSTKKQMFIAFLRAFHGRTLGALSLTASKSKHRAGFFPMMPGVVHVPYAYCYRCPYRLTYPACELYCADAIEELYLSTIAPPEDVAAIVVESVQGEGGYVVPPPGWLDRIGEIAKRHGILIIDDEVQSGFGRTGKMWGIEYSSVVPDVMTVAKALGSGIPIGAAIFAAERDFRESGVHSNTFGGNPVACAAARATLDVLDEERLVARAAKLGEYLAHRLDGLKAKYPCIGDRRGLGLMQATELVKAGPDRKPDAALRDRIVKDAFEHGLILLPCGASSIRFIPPLNIPEDVLDAGLEVLQGCFARAAS